MKKIFILIFIFIYFINLNIYITYKNKNIRNKLKGIYKITSLSYNNSFNIENNITLILSNIYEYFRLINIKSNIYFIESRSLNKNLGVNDNNEIILYDKDYKKINISIISWNLIKVNENQFLIQNKFSQKYIEAKNCTLSCLNKLSIVNESDNNEIYRIYNNFIFNFIKLFEEAEIKKKYIKLIEKEPIDLVIKYIDLTDDKLNISGIQYIKKDQDNEELRYSIRSILEYIPWIRTIFILMPNERVKYFKSIDKIKEKIKYIKDKDLVGFNTANICAFTFNLHKMERFGLSKNFIYMEDDYFIGKPLNKTDFFYFDEKKRKILPFLLTSEFDVMNSSSILTEYNELFNRKDFIHPHSHDGWRLSILSTKKFFIEHYTFGLINTEFTHNAIAHNIDDLKEIFEEAQKYEYINETLFSKERHILKINQQQFVNLYQLNIKHKKVHSIPYTYIPIEEINILNLDVDLFVINTGGDNIPTNEQYQIAKKIMKERFPKATKYEIINEDNNK